MATNVQTISTSAVPSTPASLMQQVEGVTRMPVRQILVLLIGLAVVAAASIVTWMWSSTPDYRVLYSNLSDRDGGAVVASLTQMNVQMDLAGAIAAMRKNVHGFTMLPTSSLTSLADVYKK